MEHLLETLWAQEWLSLREVVRLLLLSALFTCAGLFGFPQNAPARRLLVLSAVLALILLPWLLAAVGAVWTIALTALPAVTLNVGVPNVLVVVWAVVAAALCLIHLRRVRAELALLRACPRIQDATLHARVQHLCRVMGMTPPVLAEGSAACSTTVGGARLMLPRGWRQWDTTTLEGVLAHELVHIARRDDRWQLATRLLTLCYWWIPWLMSLYRTYVCAMEESCDDAASELIGRHAGYVDALVAAAGARRIPAVAVHMHRHHLVRRVARFARAREVEPDTPGVFWCVMTILALVTVIGGVEPVTRPATGFAGPAAAGLIRPKSVAQESIYPSVHESLRLPADAPAAHRHRLAHPAFASSAIYPGNAIRALVEGRATVEFTVNHDGSVSNARLVHSAPPGIFAAAALRAVLNTRYDPAHRAMTTMEGVHATAFPVRSEPPDRVRRDFQFQLAVH